MDYNEFHMNGLVKYSSLKKIKIPVQCHLEVELAKNMVKFWIRTCKTKYRGASVCEYMRNALPKYRSEPIRYWRLFAYVDCPHHKHYITLIVLVSLRKIWSSNLIRKMIWRSGPKQPKRSHQVRTYRPTHNLKLIRFRPPIKHFSTNWL